MVNDTEPRYRLVDADGNVVGSLFAESDGTLKLQEGTSGNDNEVSVATDGTFTAPSVSTDSATVANQVDAGSVSTEQIASNRYYSGGFDGSSPDARLTNALSAATNGDTIYLESASYTSNRTISKNLVIIGSTGAVSLGGSVFDGTITCDGRVVFQNVGGDNTADFQMNGALSGFIACSIAGSITFNADLCRYLSSNGADVTFASGTTDGLVDGATSTTVTDNGTNTIGTVG